MVDALFSVVVFFHVGVEMSFLVRLGLITSTSHSSKPPELAKRFVLLPAVGHRRSYCSRSTQLIGVQPSPADRINRG